jgi:hypothetical protein
VVLAGEARLGRRYARRDFGIAEVPVYLFSPDTSAKVVFGITSDYFFFAAAFFLAAGFFEAFFLATFLAAFLAAGFFAAAFLVAFFFAVAILRVPLQQWFEQKMQHHTSLYTSRLGVM